MRPSLNKHLILLSMLLSFSAEAQRSWSPWERVYGDRDAYVEISYSVAGCQGSPYSFYRTRSTFNSKYSDRVDFEFEYLGCDGQEKLMKVSVALDKPGINQDIGNWFTGSQVGEIRNIKPFTAYRPKEGTKKNFDNTLEQFDLALREAEAEINKIEHASRRSELSSRISQLRNSAQNLSSSFQYAYDRDRDDELVNLTEELKAERDKISSLTIEARNQAAADAREAKEKERKKEDQSKEKEGTEEADSTKSNYTPGYVEEDAETKRRKQMSEVVQQQDIREDAAMGAGFVTTIALGALLEDEYTDAFSYLRIHLGLGWDQLPILINDNNIERSAVNNSSHPVLHVGLKTALFNNRGISFHVSPFYSFGLNAFSYGVNGSHQTFGGTGTLLLSRWQFSLFKLFAEGSYTHRDGVWSYYEPNYGQALDINETGKYNYQVIRYGGGFMFHLTDEFLESYIRPGLFLEELSFLKGSKPVMVASIQILIESFLLIDFSYSKNYPIAGELKHFNGFVPKNEDLFSLRIIKTGLLTK